MLCFSGCGFYSESELMHCYVWDRPVIDLDQHESSMEFQHVSIGV